MTFRHVDALGVDQGWRCWEVGAGGVTVANWLAHRVGTRGRVLATDIDISWATDQLDPAVEVQRHDITSDDIASEQFDLVHARHVLLHLPARLEVMKRMTAALRPGGWLVIEDYDHVMPLVCIDAPRPEHHRANKVHAAVRALLAEHGVDLEYARALPRIFHETGLCEVGAEAFFAVTAPAGPRWPSRTSAQLRDALIAQQPPAGKRSTGTFAHGRPEHHTVGALAAGSAWGRKPVTGSRRAA